MMATFRVIYFSAEIVKKVELRIFMLLLIDLIVESKSFEKY